MNFLIGLHESGCYIAPSTQLTLDNISISSEGKICIPIEHVKLVPLMICVGESVVYASQMKSVLARSIAADYRNAAFVLKDLLKHSNGPFIIQQLPAEMRQWFIEMEACESIQSGYLLCSHTFLLPMNNRADVFLKFQNYLRNFDLDTARDVRRCVPVNYRVGIGRLNYWHDIAAGNSAIQPWFKHQTYERSRYCLI